MSERQSYLFKCPRERSAVAKRLRPGPKEQIQRLEEQLEAVKRSPEPSLELWHGCVEELLELGVEVDDCDLAVALDVMNGVLK